MQAFIFVSMKTLTLHIYTVAIPAVLVLASTGLIAWGGMRKNKQSTRIGLVLLALNSLITTFTSAMGGASLRLVKSFPDVDNTIASLHAWTAMVVFLLSLVIALLALIKLRSGIKGLNLILLLSFIFLALFIWTSLIAFSIRG